MSYNIINFGPATSPVLSSVSVGLMGYNYDWLTNIFLSSGDVIFPSLTSINRFTTSRKVSAICPPFSGYEITSYTVLDKNRINFTVNTNYCASTGLIDVIFYNQAGYTKLSDKNYLLQCTDGFIPTVINGVLLETGGYLLQEDGGKILIEF